MASGQPYRLSLFAAPQRKQACYHKSRSNSSGVKENGMAIEANQPEFSGPRLILEQAKLWAL